MTPLVFTACCLATYRLTALITADSLTKPWRRRLARRFPLRANSPHPLVVLVNCHRCMSVWVALVVVVAVHAGGLAPSRAFCVLAWPAVAGAAAVLCDLWA